MLKHIFVPWFCLYSFTLLILSWNLSSFIIWRSTGIKLGVTPDIAYMYILVGFSFSLFSIIAMIIKYKQLKKYCVNSNCVLFKELN